MTSRKKEHARSVMLSLTEEELDKWRSLARINDETLGDFIRRIINEEMQRHY